jgi:hypothetical protein
VLAGIGDDPHPWSFWATARTGCPDAPPHCPAARPRAG